MLNLVWSKFARRGAWMGCLCGLLVVTALAAAGARRRVHLAPQFTAGEALRYQVETRTVSTGHTVSPIVNPEGGSSFTRTISMVVRLDVLSAPAGGQGAAGGVRLRATYEKAHSESKSDAFDPAAPPVDTAINNLEGNSLEFTLESGGHLAAFKGLTDLFPNPAEAEPALSWLQSLSLGTRLPAEGIAIGQKWSGEQPITGSPLAGLTWRADSTYLRNEPCNPPTAGATGRAGASGNTCAVVLTRLEIFRHGSAQGDATPEDYRRNGLRTSGKWTGSAESLDSVSIATGVLISSTQTGTQDMDYEIKSASTGSSIHHAGQIKTQTEITLLPTTGSHT